jgi:hypothetical protein
MKTRFIAMCLLVSNIAVAAAGYFLLTRTSEGYSELLQSSLPTLNNIRALSWQASRILRAVNRLSDTPVEKRAELLARQWTDKNEADSLLAIILATPEPLLPAETKAQLKVAHNRYTAAVLDWRALIDPQMALDKPAADLKNIRSAYDQYEAVLDQLANEVHDHGVSTDSDLLASGRKSGGGLLLAASWPVWLGGLVVLLFGGYITTMAIMLMRKAPDTLDN